MVNRCWLTLIDEDKCEVKVRFKWINQNPYNNVWAVQGMAAELTTGCYFQMYSRF